MKSVLVLDNIRSVENVGAIFRTADAIGVSKIYLCGITPGPLDRFDRPRADLHKSALGAELSVSWERVSDISYTLKQLKDEGCEIAALEQDKRAIDYKEYTPTRDFALILGPEVGGLSKETLDMCDKIIEIPMHGAKESLNVATAAGIALFRILDTR